MKKILMLAIVAIMAISFFACTKKAELVPDDVMAKVQEIREGDFSATIQSIDKVESQVFLKYTDESGNADSLAAMPDIIINVVGGTISIDDFMATFDNTKTYKITVKNGGIIEINE